MNTKRPTQAAGALRALAALGFLLILAGCTPLSVEGERAAEDVERLSAELTTQIESGSINFETVRELVEAENRLIRAIQERPWWEQLAYALGGIVGGIIGGTAGYPIGRTLRLKFTRPPGA